MELIPQDNGTFRIEGFKEKPDILSANSYQARLDSTCEIIELIGENEIEFDMTDKNTSAALKIMAMCTIDHFIICDFEMTISLGEIVLELDPEDHFSVINALVYSYAMLPDKDSVSQLLPFASISDVEKELVNAILSYKIGQKEIKLSKQLKTILLDSTSDLSEKTQHLWVEIPNFKDFIKYE